MESKIDANYRTAEKPAWEAYDLSTADGTLSATASMTDSIEGVSGTAPVKGNSGAGPSKGTAAAAPNRLMA